ncbi:MAG TPA: hypothetical protein VLK65_00440 [Vicinamibacteria bacterium]|nr:hypothetical protein [Vicinamibacteria bacterium]
MGGFEPGTTPSDRRVCHVADARSEPVGEHGFRCLEVMVQPDGLRLLLDGEPWNVTKVRAISIHLLEGLRPIEIEKDGYQSFFWPRGREGRRDPRD